LLSEKLNEFDLDKAREREKLFKGLPTGEANDHTLTPIERAFIYYGIKHDSFREWVEASDRSFEDATQDDLDSYYSELPVSEEYEKLIQALVDETFFLMFVNRKAMLQFNAMMSRVISDLSLDQVPEEMSHHLRADGILKRTHIPIWAKRAVFFRERGKCALTRKDLSGLLSTLNEAHFDHIIPLANGGLNDVTNLQLLAADVNNSKSNKRHETSLIYESWY
jgi:hypothetical protein